jgi:agmatine deiminase
MPPSRSGGSVASDDGRLPLVTPLTAPTRRMPAEWEKHAATWLAWPVHEPDWPGKFAPIPWVYAEIVRALAKHERVDVLCHDPHAREATREMLTAHAVHLDNVRLHVARTDRVWVRDSGPTGVHRPDGSVELVQWGFNAWAKYDNYLHDTRVPEHVAELSGLPITRAQRDDANGALVLEGGGIEVNGRGRILVTEEWLLTDIQVRNPGLSRRDYERAFATWLGCGETIWLGDGCVGDDTHGHVDDICRFTSADTVVLAVERDPADDVNHRRSLDNLHRLQKVSGGSGPLRVIELPYPRAVIMDGVRLPASYANFYIANGVVIVPTFNDPNDRVALNILADCFPGRTIVGIHAVDLVWGLGTLHCLTQQQPAPRLARR